MVRATSDSSAQPSRYLSAIRLLTWSEWRDTVCNTMKRRRIRKLRRRIAAIRLRKANVVSRELRSVARSVGRRPGKRGKEPTFVKDGRPPLSIPDHPGSMSPLTVEDVLDVLDEDLDYEEANADD